MNIETRPAPTNDTALRIERAALSLFRAKGYAGSSIREISKGADIAVATMFHHYASKAEILNDLLHRIVDELQAELDEALDGLDGPIDRLEQFVRVLVIAHCTRTSESFVAESELRSLEESLQKPIRAKRRRIQLTLRNILEDGVGSGEFGVTSPATAAIAILTMCTSVPSWYRPGHSLGPEALAAQYVEYALLIADAKRR